MRSKRKSVEQMIEEQVRKWQFSKTEPKAEVTFRPIVTISREPGSGGNIIGERLGRPLGLDLFHQEVIHPMAKSARVSARLLETLTVEEALTALAEEHGVPLGVQQLAQVAGERPYTNALRREGSDLKTNRVSPEQTAQLWNEQGRPAPGGGLWSPTKVIKLLAAD